MLPKSYKIRSSVLCSIPRFAWVLGVALLIPPLNESAFAGQFEKLSHAKYVFVGFVNEARVEPTLKDAKIDLSEPQSNGNKNILYVVASVSPTRLIVGLPVIGKESNTLSICSNQNVIVGSYYLFIADDKLIHNSKCLPAIAFLLGAPSGKKPNSRIVLTPYTLLMLPPSPVLEQHKFVVPDARISLNDCEDNTVIVETYLDLHDFIDLMKREKRKVKLPK
ncbi:MAG: hypothetical protein ABIU96_15345 [Rhodanobacter sp.]